MIVLREGHQYTAANFLDKKKGCEIQFFEQKKDAENDRITLVDGTTNEEVLSVLIDRLNYQQSKQPCKETAIAITHIETALLWLEKRAANKKRS